MTKVWIGDVMYLVDDAVADEIARLTAALERIERWCDGDSSKTVHEIQVMALDGLSTATNKQGESDE